MFTAHKDEPNRKTIVMAYQCKIDKPSQVQAITITMCGLQLLWVWAYEAGYLESTCVRMCSDLIIGKREQFDMGYMRTYVFVTNRHRLRGYIYFSSAVTEGFNNSSDENENENDSTSTAPENPHYSLKYHDGNKVCSSWYMWKSYNYLYFYDIFFLFPCQESCLID